MRTFKSLALSIVLTVVPLTASAATADPIESFRTELLQYIQELRSVPAPMLAGMTDQGMSLDEAEASIRSLSAEELMTLQESMSRVPFWRELPSALIQTGNARPSDPRELAEQIGASGTQYAAVRTQLQSMIAAMRAVPAELAGDGYAERVDRIASAIEGASNEELLVLSNGIRERLPLLEERLSGRSINSSSNTRTIAPLAACGTTFPDSVLCEIENVFNQIAAIPATVEGFAQITITQIRTGLTSLFSTLREALPNAEEIVARTGLTDPNWWVDLGPTLANVAATAPLCPAPGTNIPGIGVVGDIRATVTCRRGVEWVSSALYDLAPDDMWGVSLKTPFAFLYYPVNYLCECYQEASDGAFDTAQQEHRELVEERLNVKVSSRSTQLSVDQANSATASLDDDVAALETKLDLIETKTDNILINSGNMSDFLAEFSAQALRLRIEADLFREGNTKIVLFQMPERVGGHLETARAIVDETISRRSAAGTNVNSARKWLADGDKAAAGGSYKSAYDLYRRAYREATR